MYNYKDELKKRVEHINNNVKNYLIKNHFENKKAQKLDNISNIELECKERFSTTEYYLSKTYIFRIRINFKNCGYLSIIESALVRAFDDEYRRMGNYLLKRQILGEVEDDKFTLILEYDPVLSILNSDAFSENNKLLKKYFNQDYITDSSFRTSDVFRDFSDDEIMSIISSEVLIVLDFLVRCDPNNYVLRRNNHEEVNDRNNMLINNN